MGLYAAYGSNLHPAQMRQRCPHSPVQGSGYIEGWRLTFGGEAIGWEGALATIVEEPGAHVFTMLYDVTDHDAEALDGWEGADAGIYTKIRVRVSTLDGDMVAWTYVLDDYEGGLPSARYLGVMVEAAEAAGAPEDYLADLRLRPCQASGEAPPS